MRDHRKPDDAAAVMTRTNPPSLNSVSPATMRKTPRVMREIIPPSFQDGFSSLNINAKSSTNANTEDLHIARTVNAILIG